MKFKIALRKLLKKIFDYNDTKEVNEWTKHLNKDFNDLAETVNEILLELRLAEMITLERYQRLRYDFPEQKEEGDNND